MLQSHQSMAGAASDQITPPRTIRRLERAAIALRAFADAEWSAMRYPHYDVVPISQWGYLMPK